MTPALIEKAKILRDEGASYEKIGDKLRVAGKTIWKFLKSYKPTSPQHLYRFNLKYPR
jgi:orotate phosphoribosyltransferase-like protein